MDLPTRKLSRSSDLTEITTEVSSVLDIADERSRSGFLETEFIKSLIDIHEETIDTVREGLQTLIEVFHIYGLERPSSQSCKKKAYTRKYWAILNTTFVRYCLILEAIGSTKWMALFKYVTLNYYAYFETENTDLVPMLKGAESLKPNCIFGSLIFKWQYQFKTYNPKKFASFILTINQAKKGMPRPTEAMVHEKEYETAKFLTTEPRPNEPDTVLVGPKGEVELSKKTMCAILRRMVRDIFRKSVYTNKKHYTPSLPSTSGNYNRTRSKGGAVGDIKTDIIPLLEDSNVANVSFDPQLRIEKVLIPGSYVLEYADQHESFKSILEDCLPILPDIESIIYDDTGLRAAWKETMDQIELSLQSEEPLVEPVGLSEALKVRVISKGPPKLYTYFSPLQKFMHSTLRKIPTFGLIGTPVTEEIINKTFGKMILDEDIIINGDYQASTDNLRGWVTETIAHELCEVLNENVTSENDGRLIDYELLKRSLTGHKFVMEDGSILPQMDGQLMGSVTSFPILCIANAAMCRWALEVSDGIQYSVNCESRDRRVPLLVNGDDCTMFGRRQFLRENWETVTRFGGLSSSPGKTLPSLPHRPIVVINSVTYDYVDESFRERKYVNLGIVKGFTRSSSGPGEKHKYEELGTLHRELKRSCPSDVWEEVSKLFIENNREILGTRPNIPWITPEYLGGPGLCPKGEVSPQDLRTLTVLIMNLDKRNSLSIRKAERYAAWRFDRIYHDEMSQNHMKRQNSIYGGQYDDTDVDFELEAERFYGRAIVSLLFQKRLDEILLLQEEQMRDANYVVRHNIQAHYNAMSQQLKFAGYSHGGDPLRTRKWEEILYKTVLSVYAVAGSKATCSNLVTGAVSEDKSSEV